MKGELRLVHCTKPTCDLIAYSAVVSLLSFNVLSCYQASRLLQSYSRLAHCLSYVAACRYVAYGVVYTLLEILAVPAVPLTMTAGIIFGPVPGVIVVSGASTTAATLSFLIARYAARDRVRHLLCTLVASSLEVPRATSTMLRQPARCPPLLLGEIGQNLGVDHHRCDEAALQPGDMKIV